MLFQDVWLTALSINLLLIALAQRLPLLTKLGWVHAGILGTILWGCLGWKGWVAVVIYLSLGSLVTKLGFAYKYSKGIAEPRGGRRGPENVWGSAATGAFLAIFYKLSDGSGGEFILLGFAASFAAKLGDTFGSEIGKRWGKRTFLITNFKTVSAGTDGAISLEGTLASLFGSLLMAFFMTAFSFISNWNGFLIVTLAGLLATLAESLIGALAQSRFSWLSNEFVNSIQTSLAAFMAITSSILLSN